MHAYGGPGEPRSAAPRVDFSTRYCLGATAVAIAIIGMYRYAPRFGLDFGWLFAKEGPLELLTFVAELAAAVLLMLAGRPLVRSNALQERLAAAGFLGLAFVLVLVAMEEVAWGQEFFHWNTPDRWAQINHQGETTLHNLLDRDALTATARWIASVFASLACMATFIRWPKAQRLLALLAPGPELLPMTLLIGFAGWRTHAEVVEVLLALYAVFYSYGAIGRGQTLHRDVAVVSDRLIPQARSRS